MAEIAAGIAAAKGMEEVISGAFSMAASATKDTINMKHMIEAERSKDINIATRREIAAKKMLDYVVKISEQKFNVIVAREYLKDVAHFEEAAPSMNAFEVKVDDKTTDTWRIYLFAKRDNSPGDSWYDRPGFGPGWEKDGIQWWPSFEAAKPGNSCMYLTKFTQKEGMTPEQRRQAKRDAETKDNDEMNKDLDHQAELQRTNEAAAAARSGEQPVEDAQTEAEPQQDEVQQEEPQEEPQEEGAPVEEHQEEETPVDEPQEEEPQEEEPQEEEPQEEEPQEEQPQEEEASVEEPQEEQPREDQPEEGNSEA